MLKKSLSVFLTLSIIIGLLIILPTNAATSSDVPSDAVEFNGHYYKVFDESISWSSAKTYCESIGGHLVTINSQEEQDFLIVEANNKSKRNYWIGAYPENGTFHWVTGEDFSYTNWASGEPNNVFNMQNAVMMYTKRASYPAGTWNDENENGRNWSGYELSTIGYICEWGVVSTNKKDIDISRDTWSFKNIKGCSFKYFKLWYPDMKAKELFTNYFDSLSGTCFGMATSAMALNSSLQNPSDFSCNSVNEIKKSSVSKSLGITAEEYIKYLYPSQSTIPDSMRTHDDLNALYNDVKEFEQGKNGGVEIGVYGQVELEKHAGHALWGIKAIDESDCSKILVYDCNHPSEDCYIYLNKDSQGNFTSWSYDLRVFGIKPFGTNQAGQPEIKHFTISDGFFYEYLFNKLMGIDTSYPKGITDCYLVSVSEGIVLGDVSLERVSFEDVNNTTNASNQLYWCSDNSIMIANDSNGINATVTGNESSVDIQADSAQAELSIIDNSVSVSSSESDDNIIIQVRKLDSNDDAISLNYEVTSGEEGVQISVDDDMNTIITGASVITLTLSENEVDSNFEILNYYNTTDMIEVDTGKTYMIECNTTNESNSIIISEIDESANTIQVVSSFEYSNMLGDADGDGSVSIIDATIIQRKLADFTVNNPENVAILGDVTRDELDIIDATCIQRYLAGFENNYNIGSKIE